MLQQRCDIFSSPHVWIQHRREEIGLDRVIVDPHVDTVSYQQYSKGGSETHLGPTIDLPMPHTRALINAVWYKTCTTGSAGSPIIRWWLLLGDFENRFTQSWRKTIITSALAFSLEN